jgi:hypothetical protein
MDADDRTAHRVPDHNRDCCFPRMFGLDAVTRTSVIDPLGIDPGLHHITPRRSPTGPRRPQQADRPTPRSAQTGRNDGTPGSGPASTSTTPDAPSRSGTARSETVSTRHGTRPAMASDTRGPSDADPLRRARTEPGPAPVPVTSRRGLPPSGGPWRDRSPEARAQRRRTPRPPEPRPRRPPARGGEGERSRCGIATDGREVRLIRRHETDGSWTAESRIFRGVVQVNHWRAPAAGWKSVATVAVRSTTGERSTPFT